MYEPLDFPGRLAALVPSPQVNLARYHGVFAHTARTAVVAAIGAACAGLMRFTQRHQLDLTFP